MGRASSGLRAIWRNLLRPLFTENGKREFYCQLYGTFEPEKHARPFATRNDGRRCLYSANVLARSSVPPYKRHASFSPRLSYVFEFMAAEDRARIDETVCGDISRVGGGSS